jgi:hypothetical protein
MATETIVPGDPATVSALARPAPPNLRPPLGGSSGPPKGRATLTLQRFAARGISLEPGRHLRRLR